MRRLTIALVTVVIMCPSAASAERGPLAKAVTAEALRHSVSNAQTAPIARAKRFEHPVRNGAITGAAVFGSLTFVVMKSVDGFYCPGQSQRQCSTRGETAWAVTQAAGIGAAVGAGIGKLVEFIANR